jgi:hypothetical protein
MMQHHKSVTRLQQLEGRGQVVVLQRAHVVVQQRQLGAGAHQEVVGQTLVPCGWASVGGG